MEKMNFTGISPEATEYISRLETQLQEQTAQLQEQSKTVETQKMRIDQLMDMLAKMQKSIYGQSSEKRKYVLGEDDNQMSLFNEAEVEAKGHAPEPTKISVSGHARKAKRTKEELAANVPVVEIPCELNTEKLACEECGGNMRVLGKEIAREELEIIPAQVKLLRYIKYSYVCVSCEKETGEATIVKAPTPVHCVNT